MGVRQGGSYFPVFLKLHRRRKSSENHHRSVLFMRGSYGDLWDEFVAGPAGAGRKKTLPDLEAGRACSGWRFDLGGRFKKGPQVAQPRARAGRGRQRIAHKRPLCQPPRLLTVC